MFVTREMDYVIRIVRTLSQNEQLTAMEISENECIPETYIYKLLNGLDKKGVVHAIRGRRGGYVLTKDVETLTLLDVFNIMGRSIDLSECLKENHTCQKNTDNSCKIHDELTRIQDILEKELSMYTLSQLINGEVKQ